MTERKTIVFLRHEITRPLENGKRVEGQTMAWRTANGVMSAVLDLWDQQQWEPALYRGRRYARGSVRPRTKTIDRMLNTLRNSETSKAKELGLDNSRENLANGFDDLEHFKKMCCSLLHESTHVSLRTRVQCLLSHASLGRGDDVRSLLLWNMYVWKAAHVGPTSGEMLPFAMPGYPAHKDEAPTQVSSSTAAFRATTRARRRARCRTCPSSATATRSSAPLGRWPSTCTTASAWRASLSLTSPVAWRGPATP